MCRNFISNNNDRTSEGSMQIGKRILNPQDLVDFEAALSAVTDLISPFVEKSQEVKDHLQLVGKVNGVDNCFSRQFVAGKIVENLEFIDGANPLRAPEMIRWLVEAGVCSPPISTSRDGMSMKVMHLKYARLQVLKEQLEREVNA